MYKVFRFLGLLCSLILCQSAHSSPFLSSRNHTLKTTSPDFSLLFSKTDLYSTSCGIFTVAKMEANSLTNNGIVKFNRLLDIHKLNDRQCALAIIFASQVTHDLSKWLFESLTPRYVPIIRKDEDHFVFVTEDESSANKVLLSPEFGSKIKYKIGISEERRRRNSTGITLKTVNLYSETNGEPEISSRRISSANPYNAEISRLFPDTTKNFHRKRFRVANPKAPFYFEMKPNPNGNGNIPLRGLYKVWLDVMMERYNFTIDLFLSSLSGGTGKRLKNGTWLGAVADILHERADMAVYIGHIYNRHEFIDWSTSLTYEWLVFITHKPKSFYSPSSIFKPFPPTLWLGFIASLVLICLTFKLIVKCMHGSTVLLPVRKTFLYLFASFMEQDADCYLIVTFLQLSPVRMMIAFWLFFSLIISTAYRGKLVSLIAFPQLTWVPSTFDDLAYSGYRVGVNVLGKGGAAYSVLSTSKSPVYENLFNRMEIFPDPAVCMREGLYKNIGCIMWKSVADSTEAKNFTDKFGRKPFRASEQTTSFIADGYVWEKRAIFRHHFDQTTWSIVETGLATFWFQSDLNVLKTRRLEWEKRIVAEGNSTMSSVISWDDGPSTLKLIHLLGLFLLFFSGHLCAIFCFFMESIFSKYKLMLKRVFCGTTDALMDARTY